MTYPAVTCQATGCGHLAIVRVLMFWLCSSHALAWTQEHLRVVGNEPIISSR